MQASSSETAEENVPPAAEDLDKTDAQRFAEAWDIDFQTVAHLANGDARDVANAKVMNRAMWPATLGFYLEELLETDANVNDRVRRFFTADVVARGSVPGNPRRQAAVWRARHERIRSLAGERRDRWRRGSRSCGRRTR